MRYAIILTETNEWDTEFDDREEADDRYNEVVRDGTPAVLVEVIRGDMSSTVPNIFDED